MEPHETVVNVSGKDEYIQHLKKETLEFATQLQDEKEVYGVMIIVDLGEQSQVMQLGNRRYLDGLKHHMLEAASRGQKGIKINLIGLGLIVAGLGFLGGLLVH